ncbi:MAG: futalosine hydrolase [Bacteroidia bacterium]
MNILIVAATKREIEPLLNKLKALKFKPDVLITGVGMVATTFSLTKALSSKKYDLALNLGICGSFDRDLKIGEVVNITEDIFSELGAEDGDSFLKLSDMKFADKKDVFLKPAKKFVSPVLRKYKKVKGVTVNTVHGNKKSISKVVELYNPDVESMEGAAFFYVCNQFKIPALQLRAVSNYVERRNAKNWNIPLAIAKLNEAALRFF